MRVQFSAESVLGVKADLLVLPVWEGRFDTPEVAHVDRRLRGALGRARRSGSFSAKEGSMFVSPTLGLLPAEHLLAVGMGKAAGKTAGAPPDLWRRCADTVVGQATKLKAKTAAVLIPGADDRRAEAVAAVTEGAFLSSYRFDRYKSRRGEQRRPGLKSLILLGRSLPSPGIRAAVRLGELLARGTCFARDLINLPAGVATPSFLGREAERLGKEEGLFVHVHRRRDLERLGSGAILAVARGSAEEPRLIEIVYRPPGERPAGAVALVGKGITFDSGGLSLKTPRAMQVMKRDMAGGAAVLGVMKVIGRLAPQVEVRGYIPACENMPGEQAYKPGDVLRTYGGKTVEVLNTDAEGRLVLADALAYACARAGARGAAPLVAIIDVATLTGAVRTALGTSVAAVLGTDRSLVDALGRAASEAGERLWELPLFAPYGEQLKSAVADLKNVGDDGYGGTIKAALFLKEFVRDEIPWAHLDVAGVAFADSDRPCVPRGGVGFGVRTLLRYLLEVAGGAGGLRRGRRSAP